MRKRVAELLEGLIEKQPPARRSHRELEKTFGIDKSTISKIRRKEGAIGAHALIRLRELLQMPIDEILGLPPLRLRPAQATRTPLMTEAHIENAGLWKKREFAVGVARAQNIPEHIIEAVKKRDSDPKFASRTIQGWTEEFQNAFLEEVGQQEDARAAVERAREAPQRVPPRRKHA
jgi:transcriptional regulator with XRE-family HTH domain